MFQHRAPSKDGAENEPRVKTKGVAQKELRQGELAHDLPQVGGFSQYHQQGESAAGNPPAAGPSASGCRVYPKTEGLHREKQKEDAAKKIKVADFFRVEAAPARG